MSFLPFCEVKKLVDGGDKFVWVVENWRAKAVGLCVASCFAITLNSGVEAAPLSFSLGITKSVDLTVVLKQYRGRL
jgi:hypothetical protein